MYAFRWNSWNADHIAEHGITKAQAELVVNHPRRGYPRYLGDGRFLAVGQDSNGLYMQVIYIFSPPGVVFVIHSRALTDSEKRRLRRRRP